MPIDINLIRSEPEKVLESENKRFSDPELLKDVLEADKEWRDHIKRLDLKRKEFNKTQKEITEFCKKNKKRPDDDTELMKEKKRLEKDVEELKKTEVFWKKELDRTIPYIGNIVHESVPVSNNEDDNEIVYTFEIDKQLRKTTENMSSYGISNIRPHHQLLWMIGGYEPDRGSLVAGSRAYFLKGPAVLLNQALINYSLQFLMKHDYTPMQPPYFMNKSAMSKVAQLTDFNEALYHVTKSSQESFEDKYLIATSEQPLCAYHMNDWIPEKDLPIRYAGVSTCFRKEAGKHGKDTWGIFRVHQFDKIEQFVITDPEDSWKMLDTMKTISEDFLQSLELPYQVVNIVSGELNLAAAKKYDIECWFPFYDEYKELVSCSNCTDYQARAVETRCGLKKAGQESKKYCHMLNSTLCATSRTICCILENNQTEDGITVPKVLVPFMGGLEFIPFIREPREMGAAEIELSKKLSEYL